jgi:hypothetical protein
MLRRAGFNNDVSAMRAQLVRARCAKNYAAGARESLARRPMFSLRS